MIVIHIAWSGSVAKEAAQEYSQTFVPSGLCVQCGVKIAILNRYLVLYRKRYKLKPQ